MTTKKELIGTILDELQRIEGEPPHGPLSRTEIGLPAMIPAGDGQSIIVTPAVLQSIGAFARIIKSNTDGLAARVSDGELAALLREAFGRALNGKDLGEHRPTLCQKVREGVEEYLREELCRSRSDLDFIFGCRLFAGTISSAIQIGPVQFETRTDWLNRNETVGRIPTVIARRLRARWEGRAVRKRKTGVASLSETSIVETVGSARYVCTVQCYDLSPKTAEQRALLAARLALAAIALLWATPSTALNGFSLVYDGSVFHRHYFTMDKDRIRNMASSLSQMPDGPSAPSDWDEFWSSSDWLIDPIAEALTGYVNPGFNGPRPDMMNALFHALWWFHEGCKERSPLLATVKFVHSMDALAKGRGKPAIIRFIQSRMGIPDGAPLLKSGESAAQVMAELYEYARSRTIHGTNERLIHDWSGPRGTAESIARLCLHLACSWMTDNPSINDVEAMGRPA